MNGQDIESIAQRAQQGDPKAIADLEALKKAIGIGAPPKSPDEVLKVFASTPENQELLSTGWHDFWYTISIWRPKRWIKYRIVNLIAFTVISGILLGISGFLRGFGNPRTALSPLSPIAERTGHQIGVTIRAGAPVAIETGFNTIGTVGVAWDATRRQQEAQLVNGNGQPVQSAPVSFVQNLGLPAPTPQQSSAVTIDFSGE